jgi:hypothetical protein
MEKKEHEDGRLEVEMSQKEVDDMTERAIIEFKDGFYYYGIWFANGQMEANNRVLQVQLASPGARGIKDITDPKPLQFDVMVCVFRKLDEPTKWNIRGRMRIIIDNEAFSDKDIKVPLGKKMEGSIEEITSEVAHLLGLFKNKGSVIHNEEFQLLDGDMKKAGERLVEAAKQSQFMHCAEVKVPKI